MTGNHIRRIQNNVQSVRDMTGMRRRRTKGKNREAVGKADKED